MEVTCQGSNANLFLQEFPLKLSKKGFLPLQSKEESLLFTYYVVVLMNFEDLLNMKRGVMDSDQHSDTNLILDVNPKKESLEKILQVD